MLGDGGLDFLIFKNLAQVDVRFLMFVSIILMALHT